MFGNFTQSFKGTFILSTVFLFLLMSCGYDESSFEIKSQTERITNLIDQENYDAVIDWYDSISAKDQNTYKRHYAYAKLGKGGFDPINIVPNILNLQSFESPFRAKLFESCENKKLKSFDTPELHCLTVRLMNQLPSIDNQHLLEGEKLLVEMAENGTITDSDYTLLLVLQTAIVLKRVGNVLESYLYLGENISDDHLRFFYHQIESAALASEKWISTMEKSPKEISKRITGLEKVSIIDNIEGKTKFLKETGIPFILENIRVSKQDSLARVSRMFFIQTIDSVLRDHFKVTP